MDCDYDKILKAFKTLSETPRGAGKMGDKLNDPKSGEFEDAAKGLQSFDKVCDGWKEAQECSIEDMEKEVSHRMSRVRTSSWTISQGN